MGEYVEKVLIKALKELREAELDKTLKENHIMLSIFDKKRNVIGYIVAVE